MAINHLRLQESCPKRGHWASFRLVDEKGKGAAYAGLSFTAYDIQGQTYIGETDCTGFARVDGFYVGPLLIDFSAPYEGSIDPWYDILKLRDAFKLPLTALQVAAEQTPSAHRKPEDKNLAQLRAKQEGAVYYHVQVRDFVAKNAAAHLPEIKITRHFPSPFRVQDFKNLFEELGEDERPGVPLEPCQHHVIEVMALRAYSPMFSRDKAFCALNCYHLAVMSAFVYAPFNTERKWDERPAPPPYLGVHIGTIGRVLHHQLACLERATLFNDAGPYHLLYEEVPYSKRLEVVPWDNARYAKEKEEGWEYPEDVHYLHNKSDTQAFITHNDQIVLISIRGTWEPADMLRDADARQVPHQDGLGQAHRGFHEAFVSTKTFIQDYIDAFYTGEQTILVVGHSLGGAIALLAAEWIRRLKTKPDVVLYTFGAPRAGDEAFVRHAQDLTHHRLVNHNDPVPGVPATWMDVELKTFVPSAVVALLNPIGTVGMAASLVNMAGDNYQHHGEQRHFMPRIPGGGVETSILWQPGCASIERQACARYSAAIHLQGDMPERVSFTDTVKSFGDHSSHTGYSRAALVTLLSWNKSEQFLASNIFTDKEAESLGWQLETLQADLDAWRPATFTEFHKRARRSTSPLFADKTDQQLHTMFIEARTQVANMTESEKQQLKRARERIRAHDERRIHWKDVFGDKPDSDEMIYLLDAWRPLALVGQPEELDLPAVRHHD